ncbi:MAG TPA: nitroreductase [Geminicoccus sp.]|uniref:nitroreductase family protein n=1 Tax=Geminicoccus sp. TaxID=2024832 RepID=UPI002E2EBF9A|nr:nitroreductase [Geminicoccus sp.]HEX2526225.1 nitroreductase [Geminicoccus sp.]
MDVSTAILSRTTVPPLKMGGPGPGPADLQEILAAGAAAPDHGKLTPFRFILIEGDSRAALGEVFVAAARAADPNVAEVDLDKQRRNVMRATAVVVVVTRVRPGHKIPAEEQIAAGAAAMQNMLIMAHARGFAAKWATGKNAYDPHIRQALGCSQEDVITGFLLIGSLAEAHPVSAKLDPERITMRWTGPA